MAANPVANGTLSRVHVVAGVLLAGAGFVLLLPPPVFLFFLPKARFWTASYGELQRGLTHSEIVSTGHRTDVAKLQLLQ